MGNEDWVGSDLLGVILLVFTAVAFTLFIVAASIHVLGQNRTLWFLIGEIFMTVTAISLVFTGKSKNKWQYTYSVSMFILASIALANAVWLFIPY